MMPSCCTITKSSAALQRHAVGPSADTADSAVSSLAQQHIRWRLSCVSQARQKAQVTTQHTERNYKYESNKYYEQQLLLQRDSCVQQATTCMPLVHGVQPVT
jgi:hypothetical protein